MSEREQKDTTSRQIFDPQQYQGGWKVATIFANWFAIILWGIVSYSILSDTWDYPDLVGHQRSFMSLASARITYGILSLVAGTSLINLLNPYFSYMDLFRGDGMSKLAGALIFASIVLGVALIAGGVR